MRLFQIVSNLVGNAIKFTGEGEVVVEAVWTHDKGLVFEVRDTGPGIPPEVIPQLGTAFRQANASVAGTHGGTGLGLALSRQLIEAMGGSLVIESVVGRGSCFRVALPLVEAVAPVDEEPASTWTGDPLSGWALVVEDDPVTRMVVGEMLRQLGLSVVLVADPSAAITLLTDHVWRLIVSDMHLPVLTGAEFVARARAVVGSVPRVVMLTGDGTAFATERAMAAGANAVLLKPIDAATLARVVRG